MSITERSKIIRPDRCEKQKAGQKVVDKREWSIETHKQTVDVGKIGQGEAKRYGNRGGARGY